MKSSFFSGIILFSVGWVSACAAPVPDTDGGASAARPPRPGLPLASSAPLDLDRVTRAARARFHTDARSLSAEGAAHRVDIDLEGGAVQIRRKTTTLAARRALDEQLRAVAHAATADDYRARRRSLQRLLSKRAPDGEAAPGALTLETRSVARAGYECVDGAGRVQIDAGGGAERAFETCSELWRNSESSAEQAFRFPGKPGGHGDLVVRVRARLGDAGAALEVTSDDRGLHFEALSAERFFYGHGTWIDAAGRREHVPARWADGHIELRVPAAVVESSRYPALLDPEVGPEIGTEPPAPVQYSAGNDPEVATDGAGYLVAFDDGGRIRAVRVDPGGRVLDLDWLDLGEEGATQYYPSVAFGGGRYLVVWWHKDPDDRYSIRGRTILPDGTLEGTASFVVSSGEALYPSVAWDGQRFVTAWLGLAGEGVNDVRVALVDGSAGVVANSEQAASTNGRALNLQISAGASQSVVAWEDWSSGTSHIRAARVDKDGTVRDPGGFRISEGADSAEQVSIASSGSSFLAVWTRRGGAADSIRGAVLDEGGAVTSTDFPISRSTEDTGVPSVAFDGSSYLVAWSDGRAGSSGDRNSVYGARVSTAGVVQGTSDVRLADGSPRSAFAQDGPTLAWNGSQFLLVFPGKGIEGSLIDGDLDLIDGRLDLSPLPSKQGYPRAVWTGESYLVAWADERYEELERNGARAVRVSPEGEILDPAGIELASPAFGLSMARVGEQSAVIAWTDLDGGNYFRPVSGDGVPGASAVATERSIYSPPSLGGATDGGLMVFVEASERSASAVYSVVGRVLDAAGTAGPPFTIDPSVPSGSHTSVIRAAQDYLVTYREGGTWLVPVSRAGVVGERVELSSSPAHVVGATDGTDTLLVWKDFTGEGVRGRFYSAGAFRGEELVIVPDAEFVPTVAWDGTRYWVVWDAPETNHLYVRSVAPDGTMSEASLLVEDDCSGAALAAGEGGQLLLSYVKWGQWSRTRRVVSRLLGPGAADPGPGAGGAGGSPDGAGGAGGASTSAGAGGTGETGDTGGGAGAEQPGESDGDEADLGCSFRGAPRSSGHLALATAILACAFAARRARAGRASALRS